MATESPEMRSHSTSIPDTSATNNQYSTSTPAERLRQRAAATTDSDYAPAWMPEVGDELVGTFRGLSSGHTPGGETHEIALIEDESGQPHAMRLFYRVLQDQFAKAAPKPGDSILICRRADRQNGEGKSYRDFLVLVEHKAHPHPTDDPQGDWALAIKRGGF